MAREVDDVPEFLWSTTGIARTSFDEWHSGLLLKRGDGGCAQPPHMICDFYITSVPGGSPNKRDLHGCWWRRRTPAGELIRPQRIRRPFQAGRIPATTS